MTREQTQYDEVSDTIILSIGHLLFFLKEDTKQMS